MKGFGLLLSLCLLLCSSWRVQEVERHLNLQLLTTLHFDWDHDQDLEVDDETSDNHHPVDFHIAFPSAPAGLTIVYFVLRLIPFDASLPPQLCPPRPERPPTSLS